MLSFSSPLRKSPELRRRFALALAAAETTVVETNVDEATSFLKDLESDIAFEGALDIYFRLVEVPERIRHAVTIHTLSRIAGDLDVIRAGDELPDSRRGGFRALTHRLQGRRQEELRDRVEELTNRARARVRKAYLRGASRIVESLRESIPPEDAVQHFIDALQIGEGWAELLVHEIARMEWAAEDRQTEGDREEGMNHEEESGELEGQTE